MTASNPFGADERIIAWRFLRAKQSEGGISSMTWISVIGITLAVFALIVTLAVRTGFRHEFVGIILETQAHITVYSEFKRDETGRGNRDIENYQELSDTLANVEGVTQAMPLIAQEAIIQRDDEVRFAQIYGIQADDLLEIPRIGAEDRGRGDLTLFSGGRDVIAIGDLLAQELGVGLGDQIVLLSPNGVRTAMGRIPRRKPYEVIWIFNSGSSFVDRGRLYLPFEEAQSFFNRDGVADRIDVSLEEPERAEEMEIPLYEATDWTTIIWSWRDSNGAALNALALEDRVMFVLLTILVLVASMSITSGLIMLVKNKKREIGILRSIGLTEGGIMRIFFMCGMVTGVVGTLLGILTGVLFASNADQVFRALDWMAGRPVWDADEWGGVERLPAIIQTQDVLSAAALSLGLSFLVTFLPARRAAKLNPVEALRNE